MSANSKPETRNSKLVSVIPLTNTCHAHAADIAERYALPLGDLDADVHLLVGPDGLALRVARGELAAGHPVTIDWSKRNVTSPMGARLTQPLFKAVGIHKGDPYRPTVIDATAGFGDDSYLLAATGCRVTAIERIGALAAMLEEAAENQGPGNREQGPVRQASDHNPDPRSPAPGPFSLRIIHGDSLAELARFRGDVVYLDPMFPPGRRTVEKKPMRVLRLIAGDADDADALFAAALRGATKRVVVKRPLRAAPLAGVAPKVSHRGQAVRYDVYIPAETIR